MPDQKKRIHIRVEGRVQGVGFRFFVRGKAANMGMSGWVKNMPDGAVELEAQGSAAECDALASLVREGPPLAHVARQAVREIPSKNESGFVIRH
jgi:acylphosphatase